MSQDRLGYTPPANAQGHCAAPKGRIVLVWRKVSKWWNPLAEYKIPWWKVWRRRMERARHRRFRKTSTWE